VGRFVNLGFRLQVDVVDVRREIVRSSTVSGSDHNAPLIALARPRGVGGGADINSRIDATDRVGRVVCLHREGRGG
jgi:hypothetical protein